MSRLWIIPIVAVGLLTACVQEFKRPAPTAHTSKPTKSKIDSVPAKSEPQIPKQVDVASLRLFIKKLRILEYPIILRPLHPDKPMQNSPYTKVDSDTIEAKFTENDVGLYGLLPDTNRFYAFITLIPADVSAPFLTVYSKDGKEMGRASLFVSGCTNWLDILLCSVTSKINSDLTIECTDSVKTVELDKKNVPIPGTEKLYVSAKKGRILKDGTLDLKVEYLTKHSRSTYGWTE